MKRLAQALLLTMAASLPACVTPDTRPTVKSCRVEFERRAALIERGVLGYKVGSEEQRKKLDAELLKTTREFIVTCKLAEDGPEGK